VRQVLDNAIEVMQDLLKTYNSGKILKLKVKDAPLNLQLIPNVERIKLEKIQVAKDIQNAKQQHMEKAGEEPAELEGFPSISVDDDEPCNLSDLKKLDSISYYYENIFTLEDMQLYKGVFLFYAGRY
jgi:hypothetical protein